MARTADDRPPMLGGSRSARDHPGRAVRTAGRPTRPAAARREGDPEMADMHTDVLVAGYQDVDAASRDFDALMKAVKDKQVQVEGAILVTHDADGDGQGRPARRPPGPQGSRLGRRRRPGRRPLRSAAPRLRRGRRRRRRADREVRRAQGQRRDGGARREAAARYGGRHHRVRRRASARGRAGPAGIAGQVRRADRQGRHPGAEGRARDRDGQVRAGPQRAARSPTARSAGRRAARSRTRSPTGR